MRRSYHVFSDFSSSQEGGEKEGGGRRKEGEGGEGEEDLEGKGSGWGGRGCATTWVADYQIEGRGGVEGRGGKRSRGGG